MLLILIVLTIHRTIKMPIKDPSINPPNTSCFWKVRMWRGGALKKTMKKNRFSTHLTRSNGLKRLSMSVWHSDEKQMMQLSFDEQKLQLKLHSLEKSLRGFQALQLNHERPFFHLPPLLNQMHVSPLQLLHNGLLLDFNLLPGSCSSMTASNLPYIGYLRHG